MREQSQQYYCGLDIGTSRVRCVVGVIDQSDSPGVSVIGSGHSESRGMRKGMVVGVEDVSNAIIQAVGEAERVAGVPIRGVTVNINGSQVSGINSRGVIAISTANKEITLDDRIRVEEAAAIVKLPANREIIQVFAKNYRLDGQGSIKDPVGMQGVRLEADTHIITASTPVLRNLDLAMERAGLGVSHHTVSSLAASEVLMTRQQKESGALLLDIGASTTNMVVLEEGEVQHIAVIPIGGMHVTNDLAIGLKTDLDVAEQVKIQYGGLGDHAKKGPVSIIINKIRHEFDAEDIHMIIDARIDELMDYVDKELKKIQRSRKLPGGIVLTGGVAKLPGLAEFTKEKLELAARVGVLQDVKGILDTVRDPSYSTVVGLMVLDMLLGPVDSSYDSVDPKSSDIFNTVKGFLGRIKR